MGKVLEEFAFKHGVGGKKHPWDEWLDGQIWSLDTDDFGGTRAKYIAHQARNTAEKRGLKVRISLDEENDSVVLQAIPMSYDEEQDAKVRLANRKARKEAKKVGQGENGVNHAPDTTPTQTASSESGKRGKKTKR